MYLPRGFDTLRYISATCAIESTPENRREMRVELKYARYKRVLKCKAVSFRRVRHLAIRVQLMTLMQNEPHEFADEPAVSNVSNVSIVRKRAKTS
ncbi:hypothetical protein [Paraburkholderia tropica]|nr:hypothetical protein [Paraburkholderia tropica]RQN36459.1 hypothetical protein EHZ25_24255 [Paraburkholderia tropica]